MTQLHNAAFWSLELITFFCSSKKEKRKNELFRDKERWPRPSTER